MKQERHCNECSAELIAPTWGFIVCQKCGLVHDKIFDDRESPIITNTWGEEEFVRQYHGDKILHSTPHISTTLKQYIPKELKNTRIAKLLRKYEYVSKDIIKTKRVFSELKKICEKYSMISHLYSYSCHFYKKISRDFEFRGGTSSDRTKLIAWLIIYYQCRIYNIPFNLNFFKQIGFSNDEIRFIRKRFSFLKEKFNLKIYNAGINKSSWYLLNIYIKEHYLRSLLQKNILRLIVRKYSHFNVPQKRMLVVAMIYVLLKKFNYRKITYQELSKKSGISLKSLYRYTKLVKNN